MRQEFIYDLYNNGLTNQYNIYTDLKNISNIDIISAKRVIISNKDILNKFVLDYVKFHYKDSWNYQDFEDHIQSLYQSFHEFITNRLDIFGLTPKGYKRAMKEWPKEYIIMKQN